MLSDIDLLRYLRSLTVLNFLNQAMLSPDWFSSEQFLSRAQIEKGIFDKPLDSASVDTIRIAPIWFYKEGKLEEGIIAPIWISAQRLPTGELIPSRPPESLPWIAPTWLDPASMRLPILNNIHEVDELLAKYFLDDSCVPIIFDSWEKYYAQVLNFIEAVAVDLQAIFEKQGYCCATSALVIPQFFFPSGYDYVEKFYQTVLATPSFGPLPGLAAHYINTAYQPVRPEYEGVEGLDKAIFTAENRRVMAHALGLDTNEAMAIEIEPSSNIRDITDFIQSYFLNLLIQHAILNKPYPQVAVIAPVDKGYHLDQLWDKYTWLHYDKKLFIAAFQQFFEHDEIQKENLTLAYVTSYLRQSLVDLYAQFQVGIEIRNIYDSLVQAHRRVYDEEGGLASILSRLTIEDEKLENAYAQLTIAYQVQARVIGQKRFSKLWQKLPNVKAKQEEFKQNIIDRYVLGVVEYTPGMDLGAALRDAMGHIQVKRTKINAKLVPLHEALAQRTAIEKRLAHWEAMNGSRHPELLNQRLAILAVNYWQAQRMIVGARGVQGILSYQSIACLLTAHADVLVDSLFLLNAEQYCPSEGFMCSLVTERLIAFGASRVLGLARIGAVSTRWETELLRDAAGVDEEDLEYQGMLGSTGTAFDVIRHRMAYESAAFCLGVKQGIVPSSCAAIQVDYRSVFGESVYVSGSLMNPIEAHDCLLYARGYLLTNPQAINRMAVVTVFAAQKALLVELIAREYPELLGMTLWHVSEPTLVEKSIVLFSMVYTQKDRRPYIYDQAPGLLEKIMALPSERLVVFGDQGILSAHARSALGRFSERILEVKPSIMYNKDNKAHNIGIGSA